MSRSALLLVLAVLAGCTSPSYVSEHPVNNQQPALPAGVYTVKTVDVPPVATKEVEPDYPPALGAILTGQALVVFTVRTDGKVTDATVVQADDVLYGEAAVHALSKWRFTPARLKGVPVDCRMTLPFVFDSPYGYGSVEVGSSLPPPPGGDDSSRKTSLQPH
jgi:TonB family protein